MKAEHYEEAIKRVRAYYPMDVFPDTHGAAKMARLTCDNIQELAEELAAEAARDEIPKE